MQSMAQRQANASLPRYTPGIFEAPELPPAPKAKTTSLERDALLREGLDKDYDHIMAQYNSMPSKKILNDAGEEIDVDDIIKAADEELEGLESIMRCSIG